MRWAWALLAVCGAAHADPPADPLAEAKAREANLESNAPREGLTLALALGPALIYEKSKIDSVPLAGSLRLGQVATPSTVITFELDIGGTFHQIGGQRLTDTTTSLLVGAQYYFTDSAWLRAAGGLNGRTIDNGPMGTTIESGLAGEFALGIDVLRRHFWRVGLEANSILSHNQSGFLYTGGMAIGLSHY